MMLHIGFKESVKAHRIAGYERLTSAEDQKVARPRPRWVMKMNGRLKGLRLSRSKKLNWKAFSVVILPRRVAGIYHEMVNRVKNDDVCPTVIFSCQWGLPVLSHSSIKCRKRAAISFGTRKLVC